MEWKMLHTAQRLVTCRRLSKDFDERKRMINEKEPAALFLRYTSSRFPTAERGVVTTE